MLERKTSIVPGISLGEYFLDWDIYTLISHLPNNYVVKEDDLWWYVFFNEYIIKVRKFDLKIDWISVTGNFKEHFLDKITCGTTLEEIETEFGSTDLYSDSLILPNYPGLMIWTEDEKQDDDSEDGWKKVKVIGLGINDYKFVWDDHFTKNDYDKMRETKFPCPFPIERLEN